MPARCCPSLIVRQPGLTTYDAKDPDTSFPPIEPLLPPEGAPNVSDRPARRCRLRGVERLRWAVQHADGRTPGRRRSCASTASTRPPCARRPERRCCRGRNHHSVGMGSITETATSAPGNSSLRPNTKAPLAMTLKLNGYSTAQFGKCHEVPVWQSSPMGPFDAWPSAGGGFEYVLRVHRWGEQPVGPGAVQRHDTGRAARHSRGGLPPHRGPGRPRHQLGPSAEGVDAGQAVLRVLRPGRHPRPAPRPQGVGRPLRRAVRRRVGRAARAHVRPPAGAGCHPGRRRADGAPRRDPGLGRHARRAQAGAGPRDGGVRRVPRAHRLPRRPARRRHRGSRDPRRHDRSTTSSATTGRRPRAR